MWHKNVSILLYFLFQSFIVYCEPAPWTKEWLELYKNELPGLYEHHNNQGHSSVDAFQDHSSSSQERFNFSCQFVHHSSSHQAYRNPKFAVPYKVAIYEVIHKNDYRRNVFLTFAMAQYLIRKVNDHDFLARLCSRLAILEINLPKPYHKDWKKGLKRFIKYITDDHGQVKSNLPDVPIKKIFKEFLKNSPKCIREFYLDLHRVDKYERKPTEKIVPFTTPQIKMWKRIVNEQQNWSYKEFTDRHYQHCYNPIFRQLYNLYTTQRFQDKSIQRKLKRDPLWYQLTESQRSNPDYQSQLLLRSEYADILKSQLDFPCSIDDFVYNIIDQHINIYDGANNNKEQFERSALQTLCVGIDNCPQKTKKLFHESGVLNHFTDDPFFKQYLSRYKINSPAIQYAINYTFTVRDRMQTPAAQNLCYEIVYNASMALAFEKNPLFAHGYQLETARLVKELENRTIPEIIFDLPKMNTPRYQDFMSVPFKKYDNSDRHAAYEKTVQDNFQEYELDHTLTPKMKAFMQMYNINPELYKKHTANGFQHHMTEEFLAIIEESFDFLDEKYKQINYFIEELAELAHVGQAYNLSKRFTQSVLSADVCWGILKHKRGIILGALDSVEGAADLAINIITDPIQFVINSAKSFAQILKYVSNSLARSQRRIIHEANPCVYPKPPHYKDELIEIYEQIKQSTPEQRVRTVTNMITEPILLHKAFTGVNKICKSLINKVVNKSLTMGDLLGLYANESNMYNGFGEFVSNYYKDLEAITAEGKIVTYETPTFHAQSSESLISSGENIVRPTRETYEVVKKFYPEKIQITRIKDNPSLPSFSKRYLKSLDLQPTQQICDYLQSKIPDYYDHMQEVKRLHKLESHKRRMAGGRMQEVISNIKHENGFTLEITKSGKIRIDGGHNLPNLNHLIDEGLIKIEILAEREGCRLVRIKVLDQPWFNKTLPPANWSLEKSVAKKFEAFENYTILGDAPKPGAKIAHGYTKKGLKYEFIIKPTLNNKVEIISSYISEIWIKGLSKK